MNRVLLLLAVMWLGLTLYTLFGGADFGAGVWHLVAAGRSAPVQRHLIEQTIAPVWEANHVWLIFVITLFWTSFPHAFAPFAATLYLPLTLVALGVIGRGAAFAFEKATGSKPERRAYRLVFGLSSVLTPFVLGCIAGGVASGRVPPEVGGGDTVRSWLNPTSMYCGLLAVGACAYLAAVYLTAEAARSPDESDERAATELFRRRALVTGAVVGLVALAGLLVLDRDAPELVHGLVHRALPVVTLSVVAGALSLGLLTARRYLLARGTAAVTVASLLWGWGLAQYPMLLAPGLTAERAAAGDAVQNAVLVTVAVSAVLLAPALLWMFVIFARRTVAEPAETDRA